MNAPEMVQQTPSSLFKKMPYVEDTSDDVIIGLKSMTELIDLLTKFCIKL